MDADIVLLHRMRNGDEAAVEAFVRKYYPAVLAYCRCHTAESSLAEDMAQETFERFFRAFSSYRHSGKLKNYLYTIARNLCTDAHREKRALPLCEGMEAEENTLAGAEGKMDIERAVDRLPDELREIIILHCFIGLSLAEAAKALGIGLPLAKYRFSKAKEKLKTMIEGD